MVFGWISLRLLLMCNLLLVDSFILPSPGYHKLQVPSNGFSIKMCFRKGHFSTFCFRGSPTQNQRNDCGAGFCGVKTSFSSPDDKMTVRFGEGNTITDDECPIIKISPSEQKVPTGITVTERGTCSWQRESNGALEIYAEFALTSPIEVIGAEMFDEKSMAWIAAPIVISILAVIGLLILGIWCWKCRKGQKKDVDIHKKTDAEKTFTDAKKIEETAGENKPANVGGNDPVQAEDEDEKPKRGWWKKKKCSKHKKHNHCHCKKEQKEPEKKETKEVEPAKEEPAAKKGLLEGAQQKFFGMVDALVQTARGLRVRKEAAPLAPPQATPTGTSQQPTENAGGQTPAQKTEEVKTPINETAPGPSGIPLLATTTEEARNQDDVPNAISLLRDKEAAEKKPKKPEEDVDSFDMFFYGGKRPAMDDELTRDSCEQKNLDTFKYDRTEMNFLGKDTIKRLAYTIADFWLVEEKVNVEECDEIGKVYDFRTRHALNYWEWILFAGHVEQTAELMSEMIGFADNHLEDVTKYSRTSDKMRLINHPETPGYVWARFMAKEFDRHFVNVDVNRACCLWPVNAMVVLLFSDRVTFEGQTKLLRSIKEKTAQMIASDEVMVGKLDYFPFPLLLKLSKTFNNTKGIFPTEKPAMKILMPPREVLEPPLASVTGEEEDLMKKLKSLLQCREYHVVKRTLCNREETADQYKIRLLMGDLNKKIRIKMCFFKIVNRWIKEAPEGYEEWSRQTETKELGTTTIDE